MAFADVESTSGTNFASKFVKIVSGIPAIIQILDEHPIKLWKHWVSDGSGRRVSVRCLGAGLCPICARNKRLDYNKDHPEYCPARKRYRVNVLELTPAVKCPKCGAVYPGREGPKMCTVEGCSQDLSGVEATPLNEVKILERGPRLMEQFNALEQAEHPLTNKKEKLQSYPIMLIASGSGREMVIAALPQVPNDTNPDDYERLDLEAGIILQPEEIEHLLQGGNFSDILAARQAVQTPTDVGAASGEGVGRTHQEIPF